MLYKIIKGIYYYRNFFKLFTLKTFITVLIKKDEVVQVKLKNGLEINLRSGNLNDLIVAQYVFLKKHHRPLNEINECGTIFDLGSNIGFSILDYKLLYPEAKVYGVELDVNNYNLCIKNTANLKNVWIYNAAIWHETGVVKYNTSNNNDAFSVITEIDKIQKNLIKQIKSITISDIIEQNSINKIDYLKMDIEGAEKQVFVLGNLDWLSKVEFLNIELHEEGVNEIIKKILIEKGFVILSQNQHWSSIFAQNKN